MSFRFLDTYDELNGNMGFPKMNDSLCDTPYPTKVAVIMHLKSGNVHMVTASKFVDVFTGKITDYELLHMNDGVFSWTTKLIYYIEKYNLRLPANVENQLLITK